MCTHIRIWLFIGSFLLSTASLSGQSPDPVRFTYLGLSSGVHYGYLRDQGVSPLTFQGPLLHGQANGFWERERWELDLEAGFAYGKFEAIRSFVTSSTVNNIQHHAAFYRQFWRTSNQRLQARGGLAYRGFTNYRITTAFRNNASVIESINSLMGGIKLQWDGYINTSPGRWFIFRRKGGQRHFRINTQLEFPVLHSAWRPSFAYLNDFTDGDSNLGSTNQLYFGGFRGYSRNEFWYYMRNGNAWKLSYTLDLQRSKEPFHNLETVQHRTQLGLFVRLN